MPTKQEMLHRIYEEIADKTLSFGCRLSVKLWGENRHFSTVVIDTERRDGHIVYKTRHPLFELREGCNKVIDGEVNIIGHSVVIGDILEYMWDKEQSWKYANGQFNDYCDRVFYIPEKVHKLLFLFSRKENPIEEQTDECIAFVYSLLPTK